MARFNPYDNPHVKYQVRGYQTMHDGNEIMGGVANCPTAASMMWMVEGERNWNPDFPHRWDVLRVEDGVILAQSRTDEPGTMAAWYRAQQEAK